jgi:hypothetical protein
MQEYDSRIRRVERRATKHLDKLENWEKDFISEAKYVQNPNAVPTLPNRVREERVGVNIWNQMRNLHTFTEAQRMHRSAITIQSAWRRCMTRLNRNDRYGYSNGHKQIVSDIQMDFQMALFMLHRVALHRKWSLWRAVHNLNMRQQAKATFMLWKLKGTVSRSWRQAFNLWCQAVLAWKLEDEKSFCLYLIQLWRCNSLQSKRKVQELLQAWQIQHEGHLLRRTLKGWARVTRLHIYWRSVEESSIARRRTKTEQVAFSSWACVCAKTTHRRRALCVIFSMCVDISAHNSRHQHQNTLLCNAFILRKCWTFFMDWKRRRKLIFASCLAEWRLSQRPRILYKHMRHWIAHVCHQKGIRKHAAAFWTHVGQARVRTLLRQCWVYWRTCTSSTKMAKERRAMDDALEGECRRYMSQEDLLASSVRVYEYAASRIQSHARQCQTRRAFRHQVRVRAATRLASYVLGFHKARHYRLKRGAACTLQRWWRHHKFVQRLLRKMGRYAKLHEYNRKEVETQAMLDEDCLAFEIRRQRRHAVRIQSVWRRQHYACNLVALQQNRAKETARCLCECQKMHVEDWYVKQRLRYDKLVHSCLFCQATWRGRVIRNGYQRERAHRNEERASFSIQRFWRGYRGRNPNAVRRAKEQWSLVLQQRRDEAWFIRRSVGLRKQKNQSLLKKHLQKLGLDLHSYRFSRKDIWKEIARDRQTVEADWARRSYAFARSLSVPRGGWLEHTGMKHFAGFRQAMLERKASEASPRHLSSPPSLLSSRSTAPPPWNLRLQWAMSRSKEWMQSLAFDREAFVYTLEHQQRQRLREETEIRRGDVVKIVGPLHKYRGYTGRVVRLDSKGEAAGLQLDPLLLLYMASSPLSPAVFEHPPSVVHATTPPPATLVFVPLRYWGKEDKPNAFDEARPMLCVIRRSSEEVQPFPLLASRQRHHQLTPEWRAELLDRAYRERLFLELNGRVTRLQALVRGCLVWKSTIRTTTRVVEDRLYAHVLRRCRGNAHMADAIFLLQSQWRQLQQRCRTCGQNGKSILWNVRPEWDWKYYCPDLVLALLYLKWTRAVRRQYCQEQCNTINNAAGVPDIVLHCSDIVLLANPYFGVLGFVVAKLYNAVRIGKRSRTEQRVHTFDPMDAYAFNLTQTFSDMQWTGIFRSFPLDGTTRRMIWTGPWAGCRVLPSTVAHASRTCAAVKRVVVECLSSAFSSRLCPSVRGRQWSKKTTRVTEELTGKKDAGEEAVTLLLIEAVRCRHRFRNYCTVQTEQWNQDMHAIRRHKQTLRIHWMHLEEIRSKAVHEASACPTRSSTDDAKLFVETYDAAVTSELLKWENLWAVAEKKLQNRIRNFDATVETTMLRLQLTIDSLRNVAQHLHAASSCTADACFPEHSSDLLLLPLHPCQEESLRFVSRHSRRRHRRVADRTLTSVPETTTTTDTYSKTGGQRSVPVIRREAYLDSWFDKVRKQRERKQWPQVTLLLHVVGQHTMKMLPTPNGYGRVSFVPQRCSEREDETSTNRRREYIRILFRCNSSFATTGSLGLGIGLRLGLGLESELGLLGLGLGLGWNRG